jgi:hypothetical protein
MVTLYPNIGDSAEDTEREFVLILDLSNSMQGCLADLIAAANAIVGALPAFSLFNVVPFGSSFEPFYLTSMVHNKQSVERT